MAKPTLFIGSSTEGLDVARALRSQIDEAAEVTIWHEGAFGLSRGNLENLVAAARTFDFAALVLTPDDLIADRESLEAAPRDNVLFECGLFMGRLGPGRTFIVHDLDRPMKIPSDLAGVSFACFHGDRRDGNLMAAVGVAADRILTAIREQGPLYPISPTEMSVGFERLLVSEDSRGWLRSVQLREAESGVSVRLGSADLTVRYGAIQDVQPEDSSAVVLPANEFFDDECFNDMRSALGAFAGTHFPGRVGALEELVKRQLDATDSTPVEKSSGAREESYGVGTCVCLDRPLESGYRLILAAVTTDRAGVGLRSEIPFLFAALKGIVTLRGSNRWLSTLYLPLMGAGHGGLRPEVSLFTMILGLSELVRGPGRHLRRIEIVVYRDPESGSAALSMPVIRRIVSTAAGMLT